VSFGFSTAALVTADDRVRTNAMYASSRSTALLASSLVPVFHHSRSWLVAVAVAMIIVQALDAVIGGMNGELQKTVGPGVLAVLNLLALIWFIH
jgi:hypothetical protein